MGPMLSWDVSTQQQSQGLPPGTVLMICFSLLLGRKVSVVFLLFCFWWGFFLPFEENVLCGWLAYLKRSVKYRRESTV